MVTAFKNWYIKLTIRQQLLVIFVLNWVLWFCSTLILDNWFLHENHSLLYQFVHSVWMSLIMTFFLNWDKTKALFSGKTTSNISNSENL